MAVMSSFKAIRFLSVVFGVVGLLVSSARGFGQTPGPGVVPEVPPESYSFQVAGAAVLGALAGGLALKAHSAAPVLIYPLLPFGVHIAHGRPGAAAGSLLVQVLLPAMGLATGWAIDDSSCHVVNVDAEAGCGEWGKVIGLLIGATVATSFDAGVLARPGASLRSAAREPEGIRPSFAMRRQGGFVVGLLTRF
jgi:hypothetical protein